MVLWLSVKHAVTVWTELVDGVRMVGSTFEEAGDWIRGELDAADAVFLLLTNRPEASGGVLVPLDSAIRVSRWQISSCA